MRRGDDGVAVSADACGEGVEAGQVVSADRVEPLREPVASALGENLGEGPDMSGECVQLGTVGQDGLEAELFHLGEESGCRSIQPATVRGDGGDAGSGSAERRLVRKYARTRW
ncbi:hypothetical protein SSPO_004250 [Streptomyces antimycoticus]|uniref:Uncharacterized protein n=1 Tax=Streptomyces antimycoticus TaxID=68175 RepID=A0A499UUZ3_9ACTN|nr:hypothetical protein [Streptomyces antimycoticus]BBJ37707.1 hypothetical protein SSPO_004250 [Streptomyces antimycoticus]